MEYIVELVTAEYPYFGLGYVKDTSVKNDRIDFGKRENALIVRNRETMDCVLNLIRKHNADRSKVRVMEWITEVGKSKRVFKDKVIW